jgi:hypothetical protein
VTRRSLSKHPGGVRPAVWTFAAAFLLAAAGIAGGLLRRDAEHPAAIAEQSRGAPTDSLAVAPAGESASDSASGAMPVASSEAPITVTVERAAQRAPLEDARAPAPGTVAMQRADAPRDSHLAAEIRVVEGEAARVAESLALLPESAAAAPDRAAEDARVQRLADALLVEHFVQDAYRGTEFPLDYPAEERTRAAAEAQVRGLTPEMRRDLLDVVLQSDALAERVAPQFAPPESGLVWEGASP